MDRSQLLGGSSKPKDDSQSGAYHDDITDLLKQVAVRNDSSLSGDQREAVDNMVKRVELYRGRHTVAGKLKIKKHDAEEFVERTKKKLNNEEDYDYGIEHESLGRRLKNAKEPTKLSESVNKVGESVNKMAESTNQLLGKGLEVFTKEKTQKGQVTAALSAAATQTVKPKRIDLNPKEVLQKLNVMNLQSPLKPMTMTTTTNSTTTTESSDAGPARSSFTETFAKKKAAQMEKMKEAYERSQQENSKKMEKMKEAIEQSQEKGRKSMQNFSMNFKKNLANLETFLTSPQDASAEGGQAPAPPPEDTEYKREVKGMQLLQKIFPKESPDSLIKLHFDRRDRDSSNKSTKSKS